MVMVAGSENLYATDGAHAMYVFTSYLVSTVGWTITAQSDGSGAAITHAATGAGGFDNNFAYRELQDPGSSRRISFQRSNTANTHWRTLLIEPGGSSGGTSTEVPTATVNGAIGMGGGTNASPTFEQWFSTGPFMFHGVADAAAYGSTGVYPMWFFSHAPGNKRVYGNFLYDACGSYHPNDTSPFLYFSKYSTSASYQGFGLYYSGYGGNAVSGTHTGTSSAGKAVAFQGPSATAADMALAHTTTTGQSWTNSYTTAGVDMPWSWDNSVPTFPIYAGTLATTASLGIGLKGSYASWAALAANRLSTGDTFNIGTTDPWVAVGDPVAGGGVTPTALRWIQNIPFHMTP